ncbi:MAG: hypothetical protein QOE35_3605 [Actinomycetota bacterium]
MKTTDPNEPEGDLNDAPSPVVNAERRETGRSSLRKILGEASDWSELRRTPYGLVPVVILGLIIFFQSFDSAIFTAAAPEIRRDLEINIRSLISALVTVSVLATFGLIIVAYYVDRKKRVPFVAVGTIISGIFSFLTGRGTGITTVGGALVVDSVSEAVSNVPINSLMADYYPPEVRGKAFAAYGLLPRLSRVIVPVVVGGLISLGGWRLPYSIFWLPLIVMGIVAWRRLREPVRGYMERKALGADDDAALVAEEPVSLGEAWRTNWSIRTVRRLFIATAIDDGGASVFGFFFIFFLAEKYHLSAWERGLIFSFSGVFALAGGYLGGGLVDSLLRRRPSRVLSFRGIAGVVQAFVFLLIAAGPPLWVLVALFSVFSFLFGLTAPAASAIFAQVFPPHVRSTGFALQGLATLPGTLIVFPLGGAVAEKSGNQAALFFAVPFLIVGAIVAATAAGFLEADMRSSFASAIAGEEWRRTKRANLAKLLVCRDVDVAYDGVQVLFGVDFDVDEGEIVALLGTNGAGKSTLLRAISGTTEAASGAVVFDGRDITHMPPHEIAQRGVIHMPGGKGVFPGLSVRENLMLGLWMIEERDDAEARLHEVFDVFPGLRDRLDVAAGALSGGEQQQLSLAQAFMAKPRLLLIDELSLGLSPAVVGELLDVVREIHRRGTTIVIVEQSVNVALTLADKAVFMEKGEVKFVGATADLLRRSDILRAVYVKGTGSLTDGAPAAAMRSERERRLIENDQARPVLEVNDLVKTYGGVTAVDGVSFALREGESLGLIGPNGSGKTTTFDLISGYQSPDSGSVTYEGVDVTRMSPDDRARRKLVRRFQDARLFPSLTVFETILVALDQQAELRSNTLSALGLPQARRSERRLRLRADRLIELLDLGAYQDKFVRELSTGLRRVADLACVLAAEPRVLLLDEPSSGIAQAEAEGLAPLLRRIRFETGCSLLVIEHDMPLISAVADELIAMDQGVIMTRGTPDEVLNDERVIASYLGGSEAAIRRSGLLT